MKTLTGVEKDAGPELSESSGGLTTLTLGKEFLNSSVIPVASPSVGVGSPLPA
jgi:hypothetical protein